MAGKVFTLWGSVRADHKELGDDLTKIHQKVNMAATKIEKSLNKAVKVVAIAAAAAVAAAVVAVTKLSKTFLEAATTAEGFRVRLKVLLGSVEEGNKLFLAMADYASKVPFQYEEIMSSATQLAGVMKGGVKEIKLWMPLIGDLAAASGLSIEETTAQVIRMYSAGAASADLFRERGILAMLGFQAGVAYSAEETRKMLMESWNSSTSNFKGATAELAKTWEGTMSMISDKWFAFRNLVMDSEIFNAAKVALKEFVSYLDKAFESGEAKDWAREAALAVVGGFEAMATAADIAYKSFIAVKEATMAITLKWLEFMAVRAKAKIFLFFGEASRNARLELAEIQQAIVHVNEEFIVLSKKGEKATEVFDKIRSKLDEMGKSVKNTSDNMKEIGDSTEKTTEKIYKTVIVLDEVKTALTGIQSYKSMQIEVGVADKATPKLDKIKGAISTITGSKQTLGSGKVGAAGDIDTSIAASSTSMATGKGHKAKIDVTGDATAKTTEIKGKIDKIKKPVKIPVIVNAADGIKMLTTVDRYHDDLDGRHTESTHTVTVEYEGKGSTTKPISEKIREVINWLSDVQAKAEEGATVKMDFTDLHENINLTHKKLEEGLKTARMNFDLIQTWGFQCLWPWQEAYDIAMKIAGIRGGMSRFKEPQAPWMSTPRSEAAWPDYTRQTGGIIPGYGGGDTVPAMLEKGEYVINKDAVKQYGMDVFDKLNAQKLASGGSVESFGGYAPYYLEKIGSNKSLYSIAESLFGLGAVADTTKIQKQAMLRETFENILPALGWYGSVGKSIYDYADLQSVLYSMKLVSETAKSYYSNHPEQEVYMARGGILGYGAGTGPEGLPNSGLYYGHKGEIVKSPQESDKERQGKTPGLGNTYNVTNNVTVAPQFMTGDKAAARQVAIALNRELNELNGRWS